MATIKRSNERLAVKCINCRHATFKQWFQNPVIAFCQLQGGETAVAEIRRSCYLFQPATATPVIEHLSSYDEE